MYTLIIKPRAIEMAMKAYKWYEKKQSGLGDRFLNDLESCYDRLEAIPLSYTKIQKDFRQINLHTFPYVVVFEIIEGYVVVYAVFHTSRDPRKKYRK